MNPEYYLHKDDRSVSLFVFVDGVCVGDMAVGILENFFVCAVSDKGVIDRFSKLKNPSPVKVSKEVAQREFDRYFEPFDKRMNLRFPFLS